MGRRWVVPIVGLAAILHAIGVARSSLPAQDGLKFLRVARQFSSRPWVEVIRASDQHPLYPAAIACVHPLVEIWAGTDAESWRIAAGTVSIIASITLVFSLFGLTRALFNVPTALLATLLFVLLPIPGEIGHDTLSDALALLLFAFSLRLGEVALRSERSAAAIGCGLVAGLGYLARPEVALVPIAVLVSAAVRYWPWLAMQHTVPRNGGFEEVLTEHPTKTGRAPRRVLCEHLFESDNERVRTRPTNSWRFAAMAFSLFAIVGVYATVKGELSEKLALRRFAAIASPHDLPAKSTPTLPPGLDDPRWDFSAKEEYGDAARLDFPAASARLFTKYAEAMGWFGVLFAIWGVYRARSKSGGLLIAVFVAMFAFVLIRHAMSLGYLSSRHTLSLVVATLPWTAAGILDVAGRVRSRFSPGTDENLNRRRVVAIAMMIAFGVGIQLYRSPHASRFGHGEAGRWVASHSGESDKVLDTRGWAAFVSGRRAMDYWHVRQALIDPDLAFIVVSKDELKAPTRRAATLRSLLAFAAEPVATFADRRGSSHADVLVYRYHRPADWRGMLP